MARAAFATLAVAMRCSSQVMMSWARSMASFRFSLEQFEARPMRFRELTI
jgi:hypothetical protein